MPAGIGWHKAGQKEPCRKDPTPVERGKNISVLVSGFRTRMVIGKRVLFILFYVTFADQLL